MGRVISFINQCAGAGKTATAVSLAAFLVRRGLRVLLADLSPDGGATAWLGGAETGGAMYGILTEDEQIGGCAAETESGVFLVPAGGELARAEQELIYRRDREKLLRAALGQAARQYDFVLLDCPSSLGLLTINALTASDGAVIPVPGTGAESAALESLAETVTLVRRHLNKNLRIEGALLTMYDVRAASAGQAAAEAERIFGKRIFKTVIPRSARLAESAAQGKPVTLYDPKCMGARAYEAFAEEFLKKPARGD